jgi:hypothetical protein
MADASGSKFPDGPRFSSVPVIGLLLLAVTALVSSGIFVYVLIGHSSPRASLSPGTNFHYNVPLAPVGLGVMAGFALIILSFAGLVVVLKWLDLTDETAALGLPSGSVRALLALGLVVVFVSVATWNLILNQDPNTANQVMAIAATAVTTVVGFYFGSNASTDAFSQAQTPPSGNGSSSSSNATGIPPPSGGTNTPQTPRTLTQKASALRAIADAAKAKLMELSTPPLATLKAELGPSNASELPDLTKASDALQRMTARANQCAADADRAADALKDLPARNPDPQALAAAAAAVEQ